MTVAPQPDQEIVTGTIMGVVQKAADKWQVEIVPDGSQNVRRIWTKDAGVVQQMVGLAGQRLSIMCGVSHWTNNSGQAVRSLWLNGFGAPGQAAMPQPVPQAPAQQWQPQPAPMPVPQQPVMQQPMAAPPVALVQPQADARDEMIHRQSAAKVAVQLLPFLGEEHRNFQSLITISERLVAYFNDGVAWPQQNPQDAAGAGVSGDPGPQGTPHTDDDIPF